MKTHLAKTSMLLLTAFLTLNLLSVAQSAADNLPVLRELAGTDAKVYNQQDASQSGVSFRQGLLAFQNILLKEGLRRVRNDSSQLLYPYTSTENAEEGSSQDVLTQATDTLQICKQSCEEVQAQCLQLAGANTLRAMLCRISYCTCELQCTVNLQNTVGGIPDPPIDDVGIVQQRDEAQRANLEQEAEDAKLLARRGPSNIQKVVLEEGTRITLDAYEEYGVPEGQTRIVAASRDLIVCSQHAVLQTCDCVKDALESSGAHATQFLLLSFQCELTGLASQLDCAKNTVNRYMVVP